MKKFSEVGCCISASFGMFQPSNQSHLLSPQVDFIIWSQPPRHATDQGWIHPVFRPSMHQEHSKDRLGVRQPHWSHLPLGVNNAISGVMSNHEILGYLWVAYLSRQTHVAFDPTRATMVWNF